jgi:polygalacturonase
MLPMIRRLSFIPALLTLSAVAVADFPAGYTPPPLPPEITFPTNKTIKITDVGAVADGKTLATDAIRKAIDECAAAGGGVVQIPAGEYLTGPIHFKSNITLQVDEGATVKFTTDRSQYPIVRTRYEAVDIMNFSPLIYAYQCQNIRITGKGTLDGQGQEWWAWARSNSARAAATPPAGQPGAAPARGANSGQGMGPDASGRALMLAYTNDREGKYPLEQRVFGDKVPGMRPCFIEPYECKNVVIEGVTVKQSPFWTIHPLYSENVTVRNCVIIGNGPNTDGCDPDSCKTVLIENVDFTTGDDCIAIKSGRDGDGIRRNAPCENITIRNCTMKGGHGAITMGSETSAFIRNVFAENCKVDGPDSAIRLKTTRGRGGGIENVFVRNVTTNKTLRYAITIDMMYSRTQPAPKSETTPEIRNVYIDGFTCEQSPQAIYIMGLEESPVENVTLKNIKVTGDKGARVENVVGFTRENVNVTAKTGETWTIQNVKEKP